jgi:glucose/arabinose dehydrogenase
VVVRVPSGAATGEFARSRSLSVPPGFEVSVFATGLDSPRWLAFSPEGVLYASIPSQGQVVALPDRNADGVADSTITLVDSLYQPHGLAFFGGALFVAENQRVIRVTYDSKAAQPKATRLQTVVPNLPTGSGHLTRTITFGPDGKLYVSAGSSCNSCVEDDSRRAAVTQYNPDGSGEKVFAKGLRNSVGLTWRPGTSELWATDNGRDYLGDDLPPDEINVLRDGADYGWPYCYGNRMPDPQLGSASRCAITQPPTVALQAHSAPLGLAFYAGTQFPKEYQGDLIVAYHGSWNRSVPTGYKLVRVRMNGGTPTGEVQDFVAGWLDGGSAWGRPVDPVVGPDGSLYVSDDAAGVIYRITYRGGVPTKNAE